ncbi:VOC family protein [Roseiterribacter gracilis]|uniref:VOC domain-containing protein n=1 Tax=Roseiterribacter gracilis TaxID=2812848 RepID=A0A8S8XAC4_9PROT|nr:hypothetical protein TMPK1_19410 [Rhodospirillales bacterium TMPK1]
MIQNPVTSIRFGRVAAGISVRDIQAAHDFYAGVLGFRKVFENGSPVGFMILEKDGAEIHLNLKPDHVASTVNAAHMLVDKVDALYAVCQAAGVQIVKALADKDYGQRAFVFADPDGNRIDVGEATRKTLTLTNTQRLLVVDDADLAGSSFTNVKLANAIFDDVNLAAARLSNVNLTGLSIRDANLRNAAISDSALDGMTIDGIAVTDLLAAYRARKSADG